MSRIGKLPILIPESVKVQMDNNKIKIEGAKGKLEYNVPSTIKVNIENNYVRLNLIEENKLYEPIFGTTRALLNNMFIGVSKGYQKALVIVGQGYRAKMDGEKLVLQMGFANPIEYMPVEGIKITVPDPQKIIITGIDKELVGNIAATIKAYKPPDHYKGQGIIYEGEYVRKKPGKKAAGSGAYGSTKS
jgi:large subunit ribosomal protein L6